MTDFAKVDLGEPGVSFVNSRLEAGVAISTALLRLKGPVDNATSLLRQDIDPSWSVQFDRGRTTTIRNTRRWLVSEIDRFFPVKSQFCLLVEDTWAKPSDILMHHKEDAVFFYDSSVIYALAGEQFDQAGLDNILRSVASFNYTAFLVGCPLDNPPSVPTPLAQTSVENFARHSKFVFVSAYDQDGVVLSEVRSEAP